MKVAAHQINFLPWLGYFIKMNYADKFILAENVQFTKHSFLNRVKIKTASGAHWLTVPVITKGKGLQQINQVKIDNSQNWQKKHWKTLLVNYKNSPFFENYADYFNKMYTNQWNFLVDFNRQGIEIICHIFKIPTNLIVSSQLKLKESENATMHIIDMIKLVGGNIYISGQSGKKYLSEELFDTYGIELQYFSFEHQTYRQQFNSFIPNISILDLLFNEGPAAEQILKNIKINIENYQGQDA